MIDTVNFAITYKYLKTNIMPTECTYREQIDTLSKYGIVIDHTYELDSKGRLHVHIFWESTRKNPWMKKFIFKDYHCKIEPIYHPMGWIKYMHKDDNKFQPKSLNQILQSVKTRFNNFV